MLLASSALASYGLGSAGSASKKIGSHEHVCKAAEPEFDDGADVHAVKEYKDSIAQLLKQERFEELECIANPVRESKARFSGGAWKLHRLYSGLDEPQPGVHATEVDWKKHSARLKHWVALMPDSITLVSR